MEPVWKEYTSRIESSPSASMNIKKFETTIYYWDVHGT